MTDVNKLSPENVKHYQKDGYLVINDLLSENEVSNLIQTIESDEIKNLLEQYGYPEKLAHATEILPLNSLFVDLAKHPKIIKIIKPLLGENIQLQHSKLTIKPPFEGKGAINWHQDLFYFPHTNTDFLAVMVMLDSATPENGCMKMVKGSHKKGLIDALDIVSNNSAYEEPEDIKIAKYLDSSNIVNITPRAGGVSIHHGLTIHSSGSNVSGKPRRGIVFQYRADDSYQLAGRVFKDTGFMVSGEHKFKVRCEAGIIPVPAYLREEIDPRTPQNAWRQSGSIEIND